MEEEVETLVEIHVLVVEVVQVLEDEVPHLGRSVHEQELREREKVEIFSDVTWFPGIHFIYFLQIVFLCA